MSEDAEVDPLAFRNALGTFATGVTVITTQTSGGPPLGLTANSFTSLSLKPPLVIVCVDVRSATLAAIKTSRAFAVSVLSEGQRALSNVFAGKAADKFAGVAWRAGATGAPLIDGAIGWFDCDLEAVHPGGDHDIVVGRVRDFGQAALQPLGYFRGSYFTASQEQETIQRGRAVFAAIVEWEGSILLHKASDGTWGLPSVLAGAKGRRLGGLREALAAAGAPAEMDFVYSVAEAADGAQAQITYRGQATARPDLTDPGNWRLADAEACRATDFDRYETKMTVLRYFRERRDAYFALFADTGDHGRLTALRGDASVYGRNEAEERGADPL